VTPFARARLGSFMLTPAIAPNLCSAPMGTLTFKDVLLAQYGAKHLLPAVLVLVPHHLHHQLHPHLLHWLPLLHLLQHQLLPHPLLSFSLCFLPCYSIISRRQRSDLMPHRCDWFIILCGMQMQVVSCMWLHMITDKVRCHALGEAFYTMPGEQFVVCTHPCAHHEIFLN